jgi:hypothetical protein
VLYFNNLKTISDAKAGGTGLISKTPIENATFSDSYPKVEELRERYFKRNKKNEILMNKKKKVRYNIDEKVK